MRSVLAFALALLTAAAMGKDHGVQGRTWPIEEVDMRQLVAESAARVRWDELERERLNAGREAVNSLPGRSLSTASQTEVAWVDPSITLASDIKAPVRGPDGKLEWQVIYRAGQRVNPLEHVRPTTALLFFDGSVEDQVDFVKAVLARNPLTVVPIDTAGRNPQRLTKNLGRPVYFASDELLDRFTVRNAPALLFPGSGAREMYLGVLSFARPFSVEQLEEWWSDATRKSTSGSASNASSPSH